MTRKKKKKKKKEEEEDVVFVYPSTALCVPNNKQPYIRNNQ